MELVLLGIYIPVPISTDSRKPYKQLGLSFFCVNFWLSIVQYYMVAEPIVVVFSLCLFCIQKAETSRNTMWTNVVAISHDVPHLER